MKRCFSRHSVWKAPSSNPYVPLWDIKNQFLSFSYKEWSYVPLQVTNKKGNKKAF